MIKFIAGVITGIFIATVGMKGVLNVLDNGVNTVKQQSQELAK